MATIEYVRSIVARGGGTLLLDDGRSVSIDVQRRRFETIATINVCRRVGEYWIAFDSSLFVKIDRPASAMTFAEFAEGPPWGSYPPLPPE